MDNIMNKVKKIRKFPSRSSYHASVFKQEVITYKPSKFKRSQTVDINRIKVANKR